MWAAVAGAVLLLLQADPAARGLKALEAGNYAEAAEALEEAVARDPDNFAAHFNLAYARTMLGERNRAIAAYRRVLELKPGLYQAQLNLGILLLEAEQAAEALPLLREAAAQQPDQFQPHYHLARALDALADDAGAEAHFRKAVAIDPKSALARIGLGRALANQLKFDEALAAYRQAAELDAEFRVYLIELAARLEEKGHAERAIALYRECPPTAEVNERLGNLLLEAGQVEEALPHLEAAVKASPTPANRFLLAVAYLKGKRLEEAAPLLEAARQARPDDLRLRLTYGRLLRDLKKYPAAAAEFLAATRLAPDSKEAWSELAGMLVLLDNRPQALAALSRVEALEPGNAAVHFFRAMLLDKDKQYEPALASYEKFLTMSAGAHPDEEFKARQRIRVIRKELNRR
jgi:tetratricopeptide (TPR) repeat protein